MNLINKKYSISQNITPLFILGIPRSGTSLLLSLLDGHPQILNSMGDSRFFTRFYPEAKGKDWKTKEEISVRDLLHLFNPEGHYYKKFLSEIPYDEFYNTYFDLLRASDKNDKDFLESYMLAVGLSSGVLSEDTKFWVEKTPGNEFYLDIISTWWPHAYFIHIVRDPRDVYASYYSRDLKNNRKITLPDAFAFSWGKSIERSIIYQKKVGAERYMVLNYEDLVSEPEETMKVVAEFLHIEPDEALKRPTKSNGKIAWGGNSASQEKTYTIHKKALGKWKKTLTGKQVLEIESLLYDKMQLRGYQPVNSHREIKVFPVYLFKNWLREIRFRFFR